MKFRLSATIPTVQYGNIMPELEFEGEYEEAMAHLQPKMDELWLKYYNKTPGSTTERLTDLFGNQIDYDEASHTYSWDGEIYESGSQYAKKFEKPFDGAKVAKKLSDKYGVSPQDIQTMWRLKAKASREFGTAMHSALELFGAHREVAGALERETHLHDHPTIKNAIQEFYKGRDEEIAFYEALVVDHENKRAGRIDRLLKTRGGYQVQDFKFNAVMTEEKLEVYWKQLDFYGDILKANGQKVQPPQIFHYDGSWHDYIK